MRTKRTYRPQLEALEERWCPDVKTWTGAMSNEWHNAGNWQGGVPGPADDVRFLQGVATNSAMIYAETGNVVINSLEATVDSNAPGGHNIRLIGGNLTITNTTEVGSVLDGTNIRINPTQTLHINGGNFTWKRGSFLLGVGQSTPGTVRITGTEMLPAYVELEGSLATDTNTGLSASLEIGTPLVQNPPEARFVMYNCQNGFNLPVLDGCDIRIARGGSFELNHAHPGAGEQGGLVRLDDFVGVTDVAKIYVAGVLEIDASSAVYLVDNFRLDLGIHAYTNGTVKHIRGDVEQHYVGAWPALRIEDSAEYLAGVGAYDSVMWHAEGKDVEFRNSSRYFVATNRVSLMSASHLRFFNTSKMDVSVGALLIANCAVTFNDTSKVVIFVQTNATTVQHGRLRLNGTFVLTFAGGVGGAGNRVDVQTALTGGATAPPADGVRYKLIDTGAAKVGAPQVAQLGGWVDWQTGWSADNHDLEIWRPMA